VEGEGKEFANDEQGFEREFNPKNNCAQGSLSLMDTLTTVDAARHPLSNVDKSPLSMDSFLWNI